MAIPRQIELLKEDLHNAIISLQHSAIGLFKNNFSRDMPLELVIREEEGFLNTITLKSLGGFDDTHISASQGKFVRFPKGKTLLQMKKDPFELQKFIEENFGKN
jgi:hypothetical protein